MTNDQLPMNVRNLGRMLPQTHWLDAACVGKSTPEKLIDLVQKPLLISAKGHGTRQSCRTNKYGFPIRHCSRHKIHKGFQTGDIVRAVVPLGKKIGTYVGRVATRATGSFNISTKCGLVQGISYKYCKPVQRKDGYAYHFQQLPVISDQLPAFFSYQYQEQLPNT